MSNAVAQHGLEATVTSSASVENKRWPVESYPSRDGRHVCLLDQSECSRRRPCCIRQTFTHHPKQTSNKQHTEFWTSCSFICTTRPTRTGQPFGSLLLKRMGHANSLLRHCNGVMDRFQSRLNLFFCGDVLRCARVFSSRMAAVSVVARCRVSIVCGTDVVKALQLKG